MPKRVIELTVNNHPGAMSHVAGLFSRRAFNIEGILCGPIGDGRYSSIYLLLEADGRLSQLKKQLRKLYDVLQVRERPDYDPEVFRRLHEFTRSP